MVWMTRLSSTPYKKSVIHTIPSTPYKNDVIHTIYGMSSTPYKTSSTPLISSDVDDRGVDDVYGVDDIVYGVGVSILCIWCG